MYVINMKNTDMYIHMCIYIYTYIVVCLLWSHRHMGMRYESLSSSEGTTKIDSAIFAIKHVVWVL